MEKAKAKEAEMTAEAIAEKAKEAEAVEAEAVNVKPAEGESKPVLTQREAVDLEAVKAEAEAASALAAQGQEEKAENAKKAKVKIATAAFLTWSKAKANREEKYLLACAAAAGGLRAQVQCGQALLAEAASHKKAVTAQAVKPLPEGKGAYFVRYAAVTLDSPGKQHGFKVLIAWAKASKRYNILFAEYPDSASALKRVSDSAVLGLLLRAAAKVEKQNGLKASQRAHLGELLGSADQYTVEALRGLLYEAGILKPSKPAAPKLSFAEEFAGRPVNTLAQLFASRPVEDIRLLLSTLKPEAIASWLSDSPAIVKAAAGIMSARQAEAKAKAEAKAEAEAEAVKAEAKAEAEATAKAKAEAVKSAEAKIAFRTEIKMNPDFRFAVKCADELAQAIAA